MKMLLSFLLTIGSLLCNAQEGELLVRIENIKKIKGSMKIALYDKEDQFLSDSVVSLGNKMIESEWVEFSFTDLPSGFYALSIFHDENDNGKLDANFMGIPTEPYGFSNNARGTFGPPKYEDCLVEVKDLTKITIEL